MIQLSSDLRVYIGDNGATYHRVTDVIRGVFPSNYDGVDEAVLENAARRGREVEALCYEYAVHGSVEGECSEDAVPRLEAFDRFWTKYRPEYISHQQTNHREDIAGTLDLLLAIDGKLTIVDLKCMAQTDKKWPVQLGAYAWMTSDVEAVAVLHLTPSLNKAGFKLRDYDLVQARRWWNATLDFWRMKQEIDAQRQKESA